MITDKTKDDAERIVDDAFRVALKIVADRRDTTLTNRVGDPLPFENEGVIAAILAQSIVQLFVAYRGKNQ